MIIPKFSIDDETYHDTEIDNRLFTEYYERKYKEMLDEIDDWLWKKINFNLSELEDALDYDNKGAATMYLATALAAGNIIEKNHDLLEIIPDLAAEDIRKLETIGFEVGSRVGRERCEIGEES